MRRQIGRSAPWKNGALDTVFSTSLPGFAVPFKLGVSDHSQAYEPVSEEIVAQLDVRKALIFLDNPGFGIPYFEAGGRGFESLRARIKSTT